MDCVLPEDAGEVLQQQLADENRELAERDGNFKDYLANAMRNAFEKGRQYGRLQCETERLQKEMELLEMELLQKG